jgi:hypothetical protein
LWIIILNLFLEEEAGDGGRVIKELREEDLFPSP